MNHPIDLPPDLAAFQQLMAEVTAHAARFGHREHLHLTWMAVRRYGTTTAIDLVSQGIQHTARYAGAPQKYHATVSRAWVEALAHHLAIDPDPADFAGFLRRHPALLDKRLIARHYRSTTLASGPARRGWVGPDLAPFPWSNPSTPPPSRRTPPSTTGTTRP